MGLRGLRPRVTLLIVAVVVVCVGIAFAAVYAGTASELSKRSHQDLRAEVRSVDIMPTILRAMGIAPTRPMDGTAYELPTLKRGRH